MKKIMIIGLILFGFKGYSQKAKIKGKLESLDTTRLNVIKTSPDSFPNVSVVFEAIKNGFPVFGLNKDVIRVTEDDQLCQVISLKEVSDNLPINISLVVDHSWSMKDDFSQLYDAVTNTWAEGVQLDVLGNIVDYPDTYITPIANAKKGVKEFLNDFDAYKDSIQIVGFSTTVDIVSSFNIDTSYLHTIADSLEATNSTAFLDALQFAIEELNRRSGIKIIVALSDGLDNASHVTKEEVIKNARELKIPIYNIGLGNVDKAFLKEIAAETNGAFYYTNNSNSLTRIYSEIQTRIQSIYDLRYQSINLNGNDSVRRISLEFDVDSLYVDKKIVSMSLPAKTIKYLKEKKKRKKYKLIGMTVIGTSLSLGLILFIVRKKKKKKNTVSKI